ncbi:hypothetical protein BCT39_05745 [Vibrio lentus]|nr:hypothetical protein BCT39_05745 [Vibrio lentus]
MSELALMDEIEQFEPVSQDVLQLVQQYKNDVFGQGDIPEDLNTYIIKGAVKAIEIGDEKAIYRELELVLLEQKQSQNLLLDHSL